MTDLWVCKLSSTNPDDNRVFYYSTRLPNPVTYLTKMKYEANKSTAKSPAYKFYKENSGHPLNYDEYNICHIRNEVLLHREIYKTFTMEDQEKEFLKYVNESMLNNPDEQMVNGKLRVRKGNRTNH